jgi:hypothetical protein
MILMNTILLAVLVTFNSTNSITPTVDSYNKESEEAFISLNQYTLELFNDINDQHLSLEVFEIAVKGYSELSLKKKLKNKKFLTIVDMSLSANTERMFIIDMEKRILVDKKLVAHGMKTGNEFASDFSNEQNSHKSSIGFFITGELYNGRHDLSMKLDGQEYSNNNARSRGVVVHSADYVSCEYITSNGRLGRSLGCPAIDKEGYEETVNKLQGGSCYFIYYPSRSYLSRSRIVNSRKEFVLNQSGNVSFIE